jgi:hypothetical protein
VLVVAGRFGIVDGHDRRPAFSQPRLPVHTPPQRRIDSDHDILSLDPAMVIVKAAALVAGGPACVRPGSGNSGHVTVTQLLAGAPTRVPVVGKVESTTSARPSALGELS